MGYGSEMSGSINIQTIFITFLLSISTTEQLKFIFVTSTIPFLIFKESEISLLPFIFFKDTKLKLFTSFNTYRK